MKNAMALVLLVVLASIGGTSSAQGDFYVIAAGKRAVRTVLVSPKATPSESGVALLKGMTSITDASETNPYLLVVEPGIYDIGVESLQMQPYVDFQGSGESVTRIRGSVSTSSLEQEKGVIQGADHMELRFLTIENTGPGMYINAVLNSGSSPKMTNVTAIASGGTYCRAVHNESSSSPTMSRVTATASAGVTCTGVLNDGSSPVMSDVVAYASSGSSAKYGVINRNHASPRMSKVVAKAESGGFSYGVLNDTADAWIEHSTLCGSRYAVYGGGTGCSNIYVAGSLIDGPTGTTCTLTCAGVFDENYAFYSGTCP